MIEILSNSALNTLQDLGRPGHLDIGVSQGGAMDSVALAMGNLLLDNPRDCAGIEIVVFPFRARVQHDCRLAITGADCSIHLDERLIPPGWVFNAKTGQTLELRPPRCGSRAYLMVAGGFDVEPVMGSRATDLKAGFGGFHGRALQRGDVLCSLPAQRRSTLEFGTTLAQSRSEHAGLSVIRLLPGAEQDAFERASLDRLFAESWTITPNSNRMGMRLSGEALVLKQPLEMLSHGILPGTVQVPASGQPMIQLADANTCGGYPKIGHVIDADLPLLAQAPIGSRVRFERVTPAQAESAHQALSRQLEELRQAVQFKYRYS